MEFKLTGINLNERKKDRLYIEKIKRNIEKYGRKSKKLKVDF